MPEQHPVCKDYIEEGMRHAQFKVLSGDGSWYGEIPGFQGVWANANSLEDCRRELREVLEDWIALKHARGAPIPGVTSAP